MYAVEFSNYCNDSVALFYFYPLYPTCTYSTLGIFRQQEDCRTNNNGRLELFSQQKIAEQIATTVLNLKMCDVLKLHILINLNIP